MALALRTATDRIRNSLESWAERREATDPVFVRRTTLMRPFALGAIRRLDMHKVSKIFLLLSMMVALLVSDIPVASAEMSIRYVDIARVMRESKVGKKAQADLQANMTKLEKRLEVKKQEVLDLQADIRKRSTVASEDEKRRMVEEFERKQLELEQEAKRAQEQLNTEQQQLGAVMYKKVMDVVRSVSKDKGYDLVLELGGTPVVLYHQESNDITAEVLSALDASS